MELFRHLITGFFICLWLVCLYYALTNGGLTRFGKQTLLAVFTFFVVGGHMVLSSMFLGDAPLGLWGVACLIAGGAIMFLVPQKLTARTEH